VALTLRTRSFLAVSRAMSAVRLAPTLDQVVRRPAAERLAMGPGARLTGPVPDVPWRDEQVPTRDGADVRVRVYEPPGAVAPVLYAHGGGFVTGGIVSCDHVCRRLAVEAGAVVVSVEYRLAPEHPFPGPLDDVEDALDWVLDQGWDASRLVVAGDSAGGNLAAALALRLRDRGTPVAGQLLVYPTVDLSDSSRAVDGYRGVGLTARDCQLIARLYLSGADPTDPFASPLLAPDLSGLPPALVLTVEHDPLHDEGVAYVERLLDAGVRAELLDVVDHVHGSLSVPTLYRGVDPLYERMAAFVRDVTRQ
jgi:acetyl esterase